MPGAEYLSESLLSRIWERMQGEVAALAREHPEGLEGWLKERHSQWHLVGRVTFHLAENKRSEAHPFAFLATYSDQVSASGRIQHLPLGRALQTYADQKDQAALESLLRPVRAAAEQSALVRGWLETRQLFKALAWTPQEAFLFLREIPRLEACGLVVKVPDWWKGRRPARPVVSVEVDAPASGGLGVDAMLSFRVQLALEGTPLTPEERQQIQAAASGLVNLRGQWVEVDPERLQAALAHWERIQAAQGAGSISFHEGMRWLSGFSESGARDSTAAAPDLDSGRHWAEVVAGKHLQEVLHQLGESAEIGAIAGFLAELRPYQKRGVAWLDFLSRLGLGACLADDMGLGKTLQLIAWICLRKFRKTPGASAPGILVVPASLLGNWMREMARFAPDLRVLVGHPSASDRELLGALESDPTRVLHSYDALLTTYGVLQRSEALRTVDWDFAVLDEAQAIKNPATNQARAVKKLRARVRIALTGTPLENRLGDLWSLMDFLNPGLLGKASDFAEAAKRMTASAEGYAPLKRLIAPYLLRRLKTDRRVIQDLPDKTEMRAEAFLTKKQAILYGKLVEQLKADLNDPQLNPRERRGLVLSYLLKLKQVCNHPSQWSGDGRYEPDASGKFLRLGEIASELAERQERCLVFTQFREMTGPIAAYLAEVFGRPGLVLHGGTPVGARARLVEAFQQPGGPPFFVLSVKAGGTGLTLTAANHVIHFDRWWNPAVENQATDRAFRIGQKRNVLVHKMVCPGTIEERVDALLQRKGALAEDLLSGGEGAEKLLTEMNNAELLDFVRLDIHSVEMENSASR
jgi:non-specific serine/threonine protein kinase